MDRTLVCYIVHTPWDESVVEAFELSVSVRHRGTALDNAECIGCDSQDFPRRESREFGTLWYVMSLRFVCEVDLYGGDTKKGPALCEAFEVNLGKGVWEAMFPMQKGVLMNHGVVLVLPRPAPCLLQMDATRKPSERWGKAMGLFPGAVSTGWYAFYQFRERVTPMPSVLVAGGAGYIGCHTTKLLLESGYHIVVLDNLQSGHRWVIDRLRRCVGSGSSRFVFVQGDVADTALVVRIVKEYDIDATIHFAAVSLVEESMHRPERYFANNVAKGIAFFNALVAAGVRYVVFSSTAAVYGIPDQIPIPEPSATNRVNPYGASKRMLEDVLRWLGEAHPLLSISLRYFNAAGADADGWFGEAHDPETHLIPLTIRSVLRPSEDRVAKLLGYAPIIDDSTDRKPLRLFGTDYPTPDGTCIRDYVHVSDLAQAHVVALESLFDGHPSDCWNVGTGQGYSVRQVIETVERVTGRTVPVVEEQRRPGDPPVLVADAKKLPRLGWKPKFTSLETIVNTAWRWHNVEFGSCA